MRNGFNKIPPALVEMDDYTCLALGSLRAHIFNFISSYHNERSLYCCILCTGAAAM